MDFFNDGSYKFVTNMINEKIDVLKENGEFNEKYTRMYDLIDEFDLILEDNQKKKLKILFSRETGGFQNCNILVTNALPPTFHPL